MDRPVIEAIGWDEASVLDILEDSIVFVSGPVTGHDYTDVCRDFADARAWLREHGARHVTTPTRLVDASASHDEAMRECIHELTKRDYSAKDGGLVRRPWYDLVVSLDGWSGSEGAILERRVAIDCGIAWTTMGELLAKHERDKCLIRKFAERLRKEQV